MKKWYLWLFLTLIFAVCGAISYAGKENITDDVIMVCITSVLAVSQFFCDRNGEKGKKIFRYICIATIVVIIIYLFFVILKLF